MPNEKVEAGKRVQTLIDSGYTRQNLDEEFKTINQLYRELEARRRHAEEEENRLIALEEENRRRAQEIHRLRLAKEAEDRLIARQAENRRLEKLKSQEECVICYGVITDKVAVIEPCNHKFCQDCVREHLVQKLNEGRYEFGCLDGSCRAIVGDFILKKFFTAAQVDLRDRLSL